MHYKIKGTKMSLKIKCINKFTMIGKFQKNQLFFMNYLIVSKFKKKNRRF